MMKWRFAAGLAMALAMSSVLAQAQDVQIPMRNVAAGTFYVEGEIMGLGLVEFLVDTGSGYTTINSGMLAHLEESGTTTFVKDLNGIMADGSSRIVPVYHIPEIRLGSCVLRDVEAAVFPAGTRAILGMRSLSKIAPFTFSTNPPALQLTRCDVAAPELAMGGI